jgi:hypothetical protein
MFKPGYHLTIARGFYGWHGFKTVNPFFLARGRMTICPSARRLGAGGALTVLQFAPLARLRPVPGLNAHFGACSRFMHTEVRL